MKKITTHSKSSLFLMEMILSILILALTCTACIRIFAAAKTQRKEAISKSWSLLPVRLLRGGTDSSPHLPGYSDSLQRPPELCCNISMTTTGTPARKIQPYIP